ncbi:T9SS type A sorting domain-containing protein [uncultured Aquimarina sp.]|uniref:DUF7619 domain-containing protein n=1 Tax=uncultured Aquimarina sp. TaxID=575652 RepID=UPI00262F56C7|nr:T9SS type A sorting domain-containing protein [uncultured Aquimarina sp.]
MKKIYFFVFIIVVNFSYGQIPDNDRIENATTINSLPFVDQFVRTDLATGNSGGGMNGGCNLADFYTRVYYRYAPTEDESVMIGVHGGDTNTFVLVYESSVSNATNDSQLTLATGNDCVFGTSTEIDLVFGKTYYFLIANPSSESNIIVIPNSNTNIINIPDVNFKNALINKGVVQLDNDPNLGNSSDEVDVDINNDGEIQESEALFVTYLDVSSDFSLPTEEKITDLTGIEYFINLEYLDIDNNNISSLLGVSNSSLKILKCNNNNLDTIDVTTYSVLEELRCGWNGVSSIDVTQNILLKSLAIDGSPIAEVDITNNTLLERFSCVGCQLTSIDVTQAPNLETLFISDNQLSNIDLSQNLELKLIFGSRNNFTTFDVSNNTKLNYWSCANNPLTEIDVSKNVLLETLLSGNNEISGLDVTQNPNLRNLSCYSNNLTELDVSQNSGLESLSCYDNLFTSLDVTQNPVLTDLSCHTNQLTSLDVTQNVDLRTLRFGANPIQQIDVSQNPLLYLFNSYGTSITNIDLSNNPNLITVSVGNNYNLQSVNLKNGNNQNITTENFYAIDSPNLQTICVDDLDYAVNNFTNKEPLTFFVDNCSQNSIDYNIIEGVLKLDEMNDGCDPTDFITPNIRVTTTDGTNEFSTFTNNNGFYRLFVGDNVYDTSVSMVPDFIITSPVTENTVFADFGNAEVVDFCLTSTNNSINDLEIIILPITEARPGFIADYRLVYKNKGITTLDGTITFQYDNGMQSFLSSVPNETSESSNTVTFDYSDLKPFESRAIDVKMSTFPPSTVNGGDVLNIIASIDPIQMDQTEDNNIYNLEQIVVNSYDPNDKQVLQGAEIFAEETDEYLDYVIRFQNTGTASAINVRITDVLSEKLDWNTIEPVSASHDYRVQITNDNFIEFIFENINLPAEQNDQEGSNGFVAFRIKLKNDVIVGDIIEGKANIYFDFNPPIITNTVSTEVIELLNIEDVTPESLTVVLYPNPVNEIVNIRSEIPIEFITIFDINGRLLKRINIDSSKSELQVPVDDLVKGIYFFEISSIKKQQVLKIIKN